MTDSGEAWAWPRGPRGHGGPAPYQFQHSTRIQALISPLYGTPAKDLRACFRALAPVRIPHNFKRTGTVTES